MVYMRTLGRFELVSGPLPNEHVIRAQNKRIILHTYLTLATPMRTHWRDTLLGLIWPELSTEEARRALLALRETTDGDCVDHFPGRNSS